MFRPLWTSQGPPSSSFLFASVMNEHSHFITQTYIRVLLHTETGLSFFVFVFCFSQFVVSFSFLQKMQTKEKQGFPLKVHLFFNMKTLIELVGSPMQWSAKSFGNWQNIWRLRSWGLFEGTSLRESWAKGNGCGEGGRLLGRSRKEKRKECHWWGRKWKTASVSSLLPPSLSSCGWTIPAHWGWELSLLVPRCILFSLHLFPYFNYYVFGFPQHLTQASGTKKLRLFIRNRSSLFFTEVRHFSAEKPVSPEHSTVVNLWVPLEPSPLPSSPLHRKWEFMPLPLVTDSSGPSSNECCSGSFSDDLPRWHLFSGGL